MQTVAEIPPELYKPLPGRVVTAADCAAGLNPIREQEMDRVMERWDGVE